MNKQLVLNFNNFNLEEVEHLTFTLTGNLYEAKGNGNCFFNSIADALVFKNAQPDYNFTIAENPDFAMFLDYLKMHDTNKNAGLFLRVMVLFELLYNFTNLNRVYNINQYLNLQNSNCSMTYLINETLKNYTTTPDLLESLFIDSLQDSLMLNTMMHYINYLNSSHPNRYLQLPLLLQNPNLTLDLVKKYLSDTFTFKNKEKVTILTDQEKIIWLLFNYKNFVDNTFLPVLKIIFKDIFKIDFTIWIANIYEDNKVNATGFLSDVINMQDSTFDNDYEKILKLEANPTVCLKNLQEFFTQIKDQEKIIILWYHQNHYNFFEANSLSLLLENNKDDDLFLKSDANDKLSQEIISVFRAEDNSSNLVQENDDIVSSKTEKSNLINNKEEKLSFWNNVMQKVYCFLLKIFEIYNKFIDDTIKNINAFVAFKNHNFEKKDDKKVLFSS